MDYLFKLDNQDLIEPITEDLEGWRVIEGEPTMKTWIMRTSNDGSMISGVWTATPGTYHAVMPSMSLYTSSKVASLLLRMAENPPTCPLEMHLWLKQALVVHGKLPSLLLSTLILSFSQVCRPINKSKA